MPRKTAIHKRDNVIVQRLVLALALLVTAVAPSLAQADTTASRIARELGPLLAKHKVPGVAVGVVANGKVLWQGGVGAVEAGTQSPITATTRFQIASISKPITALAVLRLAKQGKLKLDEDVNLGLSSWKLPLSKYTLTQPVTARLLLMHRAGINLGGSWGFSRAEQPRPSLVDFLNGTHSRKEDPAVKSIAEPNKKYRYSGGGYAIIQQYLEDTQHEPYSALVQREVFAPTGMKQACVVIDPQSTGESDFAVGYSRKGTVINGKWRYYPFAAAGGIYASVDDLTRLAIAVLDAYHGRDSTWLSRADILEMIRLPYADKGDYAMGWHVVKDKTGQVSIAHSGLNSGFISVFKIDLDLDSAGVVLTNSEKGNALWQVAITSVVNAHKVSDK
jgi:CubicO group peptidase (beta-lactamase class C family)